MKQTVNLSPIRLRRFESFPAHIRSSLIKIRNNADFLCYDFLCPAKGGAVREGFEREGKGFYFDMMGVFVVEFSRGQ